MNIQCNLRDLCFTMELACTRCTRNASAANPELDLYEDLSYIVEPLVDIDKAEKYGILKEVL